MDGIIKRLTLAEMAERLNFTAKTFKKHVDERGIPHLRIGRSLRFDPVEVEAMFRVERTPATPVRRRVRVVNSAGRFAERLGL